MKKPENTNDKEPPSAPDNSDSGDQIDRTTQPPDDPIIKDTLTDTPIADTPITDKTAPDKPVQNGKVPAIGDLVINELHTDPKSIGGDANGDGKVSSDDDEFIEIVNVTNEALDLGGLVISNSKKDVFTFPTGVTLPPMTAVVVFGGGFAQDTDANSGKPHPKFNDSLIYTTSSLGFTNGGLVVSIKGKDGTELSTFGYGSAGVDCPGDKDQSLTLWPDLTGKCVLHTTASTTGQLFSPGSRVGGGKFSDPAPPPVEPVVEVVPDGGSEVAPPTDKAPIEVMPDVPTGPAPQVGELVINEVLSDPSSTKGDANKDGKISSSEDEFIEIVNVSGKALQVGGIEIHFKGAKRSALQPLLLPPKGVIVFFDGGMANDPEVNTGKPHSKFGGAYVYTGSLGPLNNTGAQSVQLKNAAGTEISKFDYGSTTCRGDKDQSITLNPDLTGTCALHSTVKTGVLFSPGTKADGLAF